MGHAEMAVIKKILIISNPLLDRDFSFTRHLIELVQENGGDVLLTDEAIDSAVLSNYSFTALPRNQAFKQADLVMTVGGDGTMLSAAAEAALLEKPLLGVNGGTVGFMTELELSELKMIEALFHGKYTIDPRMMLSVSVMRGDKAVYSAQVLNDVVVKSGAFAHVVSLDMEADGHLITRLRADGVIISTPTGSTAYSMSSGGPVVDPHAEAIIITPICSISNRASSFVLPPKSVVHLKNMETRQWHNDQVFLTADGIGEVCLNRGDVVSVSRSDLICRLARIKEFNFYDLVNKKLFQ